MYRVFFNFKEKPFKLVPNPEFLFLGQSHEEALAHLTYATSQGDGFVKITGEVGTGKTTLCRVFLEDLEKDVEAAFIFNSKVNSVQLLKAISNELGIISTDSDPSDITHTLNEFLLEKKLQGKSVILLIDEAQNLGRETLEQLRLLSNLETTRSKLLQIILVGQPELDEILDSYEMRQLRQRINLSCHVLPLTEKETVNYIEHRINVASRKPQTIFNRGALKAIYKYSRGIPRLINIACDRSLLAAYSVNKKKVTSATVRIVLNELDTHRHVRPGSNSMIKKTAPAFFCIVFLTLFFLLGFRDMPFKWMSRKTETVTVKNMDKPEKLPEHVPPVVVGKKQLPELPENVVAEIPLSFAAPSVSREAVVKKNHFIIKNASTRENVFSHIISLWGNQPFHKSDPGINQIESDTGFFEVVAAENNFHLLHLEGGTELIEKFNLPAILGVNSTEDTEKKYVVIAEITMENDYVIFAGDDGEKVRVDPAGLVPCLSGDVYIAWKENLGYTRIISEKSPIASIVSVKMLLRDIGFSDIDLTPVYNAPVKDAVKQIQKKYGLTQDGIVGPLTKIVLYNEKREESVPYLNKSHLTSDKQKG